MAEHEQVDFAALLKLMHEECTVSSIKRLLQAAKKDGYDVRISADNKDQYINRNLRSAIEQGALPLQTVYAELCAAEENGRQHIFYYTPRPAAKAPATVADPHVVATGMMGADWSAQYGKPRFHIQPRGVMWSHFRTFTDAAGRMGWVAKAYAGIPRKYHLGDTIEHYDDGDVINRRYKMRLSREVYLAKWHPFGLLELRVPPADSRDDVLESESKFWTMMLAPALHREQFDLWDLAGARRAMRNSRKTQKNIYRLGNIRVYDSTMGTMTVCPHTSDDDADDAPERSKALDLYSNNDSPYLVATWLKQGPIEEEFRTVIGKLRTNEMEITGKTTAEAVDYVTFRLREFAELATGAGSRSDAA